MRASSAAPAPLTCTNGANATMPRAQFQLSRTCREIPMEVCLRPSRTRTPTAISEVSWRHSEPRKAQPALPPSGAGIPVTFDRACDVGAPWRAPWHRDRVARAPPPQIACQHVWLSYPQARFNMMLPLTLGWSAASWLDRGDFATIVRRRIGRKRRCCRVARGSFTPGRSQNRA